METSLALSFFSIFVIERNNVSKRKRQQVSVKNEIEE